MPVRQPPLLPLRLQRVPYTPMHPSGNARIAHWCERPPDAGFRFVNRDGAVPTGKNRIETGVTQNNVAPRREPSFASVVMVFRVSVTHLRLEGRLAGYCLRTRTILSLGVMWRYERVREIVIETTFLRQFARKVPR
jgi:hypothetical protein